MTDEAIQEGFRAIRSGSDYDGLYRSAQCRSQADWLVGMNASRAFTLRYDALLSVGRVQTPTLAILVKRRKEIEDFKPEEYATVTADFGDYRGMYFREGLSRTRTSQNRRRESPRRANQESIRHSDKRRNHPPPRPAAPALRPDQPPARREPSARLHRR